MINATVTTLALPAPTSSRAELTSIYPRANRFYFLFKQGIKRTNLQFVELLSLLRLHTSAKGNHPDRELGAISPEEALEFVKEHLHRVTGASGKAYEILQRRKGNYILDVDNCFA
jgi:hypothetical protein